MNYLGIDWGEKRIGLAFADEIGIAMPLPAAVAPSKKERMRQIETMITQRRAQELVVGYPLNMDGSVGFKAREVDEFIVELEKRFRLPIHRVDERLSSHSVEQGLKGQKKKPSRQSGEIDSRAAALILQDFIEERNISNAAQGS
ncbi:Holliday junction resolvase RuvX [Coraliomargarita algicola]|uniref:Putative pre-16S rRNA nuclease n=1 Tax=Coraliomargarita algicola TaxID=3092156 RepID=A0ABZ0RHW8_9BACT|nr:Holliday junction resolvase RuvX [Coraliomargarita sp. J2-16]WPJ95789.1 Holliday junction resolvase RuvX [Coraliomargarita sp. J2-16]